MLRTEIFSVTLPANVFTPILPNDIDSYTMVQVKNDPGDLDYAFKEDGEYVSLVDEEYFQHPFNYASELVDCNDRIYMRSVGGTTIKVEVMRSL